MSDLLSRSLGPRIRVGTRFSSDVPPALVDANQLELAILNLAVNARDAMPAGGALTIEVDTVAQVGTAAERPRRVRLRVSDEGMGMDEATLRRAMEPFYTTKEAGKGTGLGLSIVHGLAAQSGGEFTLRSTPRLGTTAEILLPVADAAVVRVPVGEAAQEPCGASLLVMVVDDDADVLEGSAAVVEALGHRALRAGSGPEALQALAGAPGVDVVLTDYLMPGMSGLELARRIHESAPHLPVILATGYADVSEGDIAIPSLQKPFRLGRLAAMLDHVTAASSRATAAA